MSMNDNYEITEITQMMGDNTRMKNDVNQAAGMVRSMFNDKYVAPITRAIAQQNKKARKNPCKEARLLEAMKPFMAEHQHHGINQALEALFMIETLQGLKTSLPVPTRSQAQISAAGHDPSVHHDGIYEVDQDCLGRGGMQHNMLPLLFAMLAMRNK